MVLGLENGICKYCGARFNSSSDYQEIHLKYDHPKVYRKVKWIIINRMRGTE